MVNLASRRADAPTIVLAATLAFAAACWVATGKLVQSMATGAMSGPGPFGAFAVAWVVMMAAMMLPGAAPAIARRARTGGRFRAAALFAGAYLAVWALTGVVAYTVDRPHDTTVTGAVVIAAGVYELTPAKRYFRRRCREDTHSGWDYGLCCVGSCVGLMGMLVALGAMSLTWMAVTAVLTCVQKLLAADAVIDVPVAAAIIGLGVVIVVAPALIPGLTPVMSSMTM